MRRIGTLGASVAAVLALAALTAGGAQAAKLVLSSAGKPLATGATVFDELRIADCLQFSQGTLGTNARSTVAATFKAVVAHHCETEFPGNGGIKRVTMTAGGNATFTGNFELTVPGPCMKGWPAHCVRRSVARGSRPAACCRRAAFWRQTSGARAGW